MVVRVGVGSMLSLFRHHVASWKLQQENKNWATIIKHLTVCQLSMIQRQWNAVFTNFIVHCTLSYDLQLQWMYVIILSCVRLCNLSRVTHSLLTEAARSDEFINHVNVMCSGDRLNIDDDAIDRLAVLFFSRTRHNDRQHTYCLIDTEICMLI